ncbi:MAG: hypothetical protein ACK6DZ_18425 [Acidobacteriota bacterium]
MHPFQDGNGRRERQHCQADRQLRAHPEPLLFSRVSQRPGSGSLYCLSGASGCGGSSPADQTLPCSSKKNIREGVGDGKQGSGSTRTGANHCRRAPRPRLEEGGAGLRTGAGKAHRPRTSRYRRIDPGSAGKKVDRGPWAPVGGFSLPS